MPFLLSNKQCPDTEGNSEHLCQRAQAGAHHLLIHQLTVRHSVSKCCEVSSYYSNKPQSRFARLWLVASVWVMLHMRVKVHSPTPPPTGPSRIHQFANCHRARPAVQCDIHRGLTANDRWRRIYRSQQRSLSLGKGLMLAEAVAQTDASDFLYIDATTFRNL